MLASRPAMRARKRKEVPCCENKKALREQGFDLRNFILEWVFVVGEVVHAAAGLNKHARTAAAAVIRYGLPGAGQVGRTEITAATIVFNKFLDVQQRPQL